MMNRWRYEPRSGDVAVKHQGRSLCEALHKLESKNIDELGRFFANLVVGKLSNPA